MGGDIAQRPVSLPEIKFSCPVQFFWISLFFPNILFGIAAPRRRCLGYSKVYCDVRKGWLLAWNQNRHITYSIFHIPYTNSKSLLVFFTFAPTSFALVSLLTFHTSTILAPLWFTNFECCRFQNFSTLSC